MGKKKKKKNVNREIFISSEEELHHETFKNQNYFYTTHHVWRRSEDGEEVNGNASADEHGRGQGREALAAGAAGGVLARVESDYHAALLQIIKTPLQIATESLKDRERERESFNIGSVRNGLL